MDLGSKVNAVIAAAELEGKSFVSLRISFVEGKDRTEVKETAPGIQEFIDNWQKDHFVEINRNDSRQPSEIVNAIKSTMEAEMAKMQTQMAHNMNMANLWSLQQQENMMGQKNAMGMANIAQHPYAPQGGLTQHQSATMAFMGQPGQPAALGLGSPTNLASGPPRSPPQKKTSSQAALDMIDKIINLPRRKK